MRALFVTALLAAGCAQAPIDEDNPGDGTVPYGATLDLSAFAPGTPAFADEGEVIVPCSAGGVVVEGGALEVRTGLCDPADVVFVLPDAPPGAHLKGLLTHDVLLADGGLGHVGLTLGEDVLWELEVPIPAAAEYVPIDAVLPDGAVAGALLGLHVHNHGANVWRVHELELSR